MSYPPPVDTDCPHVEPDGRDQPRCRLGGYCVDRYGLCKTRHPDPVQQALKGTPDD